MTFCGRNRNTGITIYNSVNELPSSWDVSLPQGHPLRSQMLAVYEAARLPDIDYYYACMGDVHKPDAFAYFQVLHIQDKHLGSSLFSGIRGTLARLLLRTIQPRLLVAGHLFRHDIATFYSNASLGAMEAYRAYETMIQEVLKKSCASAALIKDMPEQLITYFRNFAPHYMALRNDISMEMSLDANWKKFDDYEAALKHKYAQRLRKVRQHISRLSIRELSLTEVWEQQDKLYHLYRQVTEKQPVRLGFLNAAFLLPILKEYYTDTLKVWAFYEGEEMVAFASAWLHETSFDMFYIGFDYSKNSALQLYFNILFFSIEQAIFFQKTQLILGRTALDAKARMGCSPRYLYSFLYIKNKYLRNMVHRQQAQQYLQEGAWEDRHPFKNR